MKMNLHSLFALAASSAVLALTACSPATSSSPVANLSAEQAANAGNFTTVYFVGDSLTAGYQSGSLIDTSQPHGWANQVAMQAKFTIALPLIAPPGAPNQITLVSLSPVTLGELSGTTTGRDDFSLQPTDVAVPGAYVNDVLNTYPLLQPTTGQQELNQLVLGYPGFGYGVARSQAQQAAAANPTTIFLWIGNNDALIADITGLATSMTSLSDFTTQYQQMMTYLTTMTTAHLVIGNVPDVTSVPYLTPAAEVLAEASAETGVPAAALSAVLGIQAGDLVNPTGTAQITPILTGQQAGPISDAGFLSAAEVATVQARVTDFNKVIAASATAAGATQVDINALFAQTQANGLVENGIPANTTFLGGVFSLDGIHPTNTGYAVIANKFIDTMNTAFKTTIPDDDVAAIAAVDPLYPPYPGAVQGARIPRIPKLSAARLKAILGTRE